MPEQIHTGHKEWDFAIKNADGEIETQRLTSDTYEPSVDQGDFIRQAKPTIVRASRAKRKSRTDTVDIVASDAQIPFQNEVYVDQLLDLITRVQPDRVTLLGDMLDITTLSKYEQRTEWAGRMQEALDRYHLLLAQIRATGVGRLAVVHGNHEERLPKFLRRDAAELIGLRRANDAGALGVLTIAHLARYDELEIEAVTGYPNGTYWLENNLQGIHGTEAKKRGQSAANYLAKQAVSTLFGHDHRLQVAWQTQPTGDGLKDMVAASAGALCYRDGKVPGVHFTTAESGEVIHRAEDWQAGALIVPHNPRNHDVTPVRFGDDGRYNIGAEYYNVA